MRFQNGEGSEKLRLRSGGGIEKMRFRNFVLLFPLHGGTQPKVFHLICDYIKSHAYVTNPTSLL